MKSKHGTTYDTHILPPTWQNQFDQIQNAADFRFFVTDIELKSKTVDKLMKKPNKYCITRKGKRYILKRHELQE